MKDLTSEEYAIIHSDDYKHYLKALCHVASFWVGKIRVQYADKALEMYKDETVRKIVLAYGEEVEKQERERLSDFEFRANHGTALSLEDSSMNYAKSYANTIQMLFGIEF